jgi:hypothetical protein
LVTFFDTGQVDDSLFTYQPMDFHVKRGYPTLAKIALAVVVVVIAGLVVLVQLIVRRVIVRRREAAQTA